ncbi:MAG: hypothetical protein MJ085_03485 [Clostridia bacterium]|nr:hypothetical protein [Clostridia bacterium]
MKECTPADKPKYNYIFYKVTQDYLKPLFVPLRKYDYVRVYDRAFDGSRFLQKLFFFHFSERANRHIRLPFKRLWFRKICKKDFENDKPCCYFFNGGKYLREAPEIYDYIKKLNPENKVVVYFLDLIEKTAGSIECFRNCSDAIISYDRGDAEKHKIDCFEEIAYGAITNVTEPTEFDWDVYFLGFAKDRLARIHSAYRVLTAAGLRCNFIICGTKIEDRIEGAGLHYQDPISYAENLENVKKSRCILELMQGGSNAATLRTQEAITYKRKLLTDHVSAMGQPYFNKDFMSVFSEPEEIDTTFAKQPIDYSAFDFAYDLSPHKLIDYLENFWSEKE